jgi:hypothetical protein
VLAEVLVLPVQRLHCSLPQLLCMRWMHRQSLTMQLQVLLLLLLVVVEWQPPAQPTVLQ